MNRITESDIYGAFILLCNELERKCYVPESLFKKFKKGNPYFPIVHYPASKHLEVGSWGLCNVNGFWRIEEIANEAGGIRHPSIGGHGYKARDFFNFLHDSRFMAEFIKKKEKGI